MQTVDLEPVSPFRQGSEAVAARQATDYTSAASGSTSTVSQAHQVGASAPPLSGTRVTGTDKWEGLILEVDDELMTAELSPLGRPGPSLLADFETGLLGDDAAIATPGDVFYLTVRTVRDARGYPYKTEHLRLRRLGVWTDDDVTRIAAQATTRLGEIEDLFG
ncbi:hypothetical protein E2C00_08535 [Streptomyces sp. WAC05374]|uniref:hypothetical protein n=1 Tax=Streptomyces sp. WAC05374 TaxID=2487420 RepID=UPI000F890042|nr:hypothetical protein [Streptomyces sp. WAC05374]RST19352.1 hypothetical protein EF905_01835 [Streptomyces sp. WAC05374]TDF47654.1 hypothetical protein E2C02_30005 [Streptomyces sp. WAC05374]TDF48662.1 hypothetical protein E2B92_07325 [Streptomyces sp. WAC05374]TDF59088.1 hypothetical protein E2C00_08535 [Streptomyces sp. WAC05374]